MFKVWKEELADKDVFFRVLKVLGDVALCAVDKSGERVAGGTIAHLTYDGRLKLCTSVSESIGLKLDSNHRIKIES